MGRRQRPGGLGADPEDLPDFHRPRCVELLLERTPGDVLHHEIRQPTELIDGVDGDDVLVGDGGDGPRLAFEPASGVGPRAPVPG